MLALPFNFHGNTRDTQLMRVHYEKADYCYSYQPIIIVIF